MLLDRWPRFSPLIAGEDIGPFWQFWFTNIVTLLNLLLGGVQFGEGSPETVVTAKQGSIFLRSDGGALTTLYVKTSGGVDPATLTNTGWVAK